MFPLGYSFLVDASGLVYTFISAGIKPLTKKVIFTAINPVYYNVELRTEEDDALLPDTENSNNGDVFTVLQTCTYIIHHFMSAHSTSAIYIRGSDERRQRRYQHMLSDAISEDKSLKIFGELPDGSAEPFRDDRHYEGYLVFRSK